MAADLTQRVVFLMTADELQRLDNWRFARHISSRGEALRRLIKLGMEAADLDAETDV